MLLLFAISLLLNYLQVQEDWLSVCIWQGSVMSY